MTDFNTLSLNALYDELTRGGHVLRLLELARDEDLGTAGDITSRACIPEGRAAAAAVVHREGGVVAGLRTLPEVLRVFAPGVSAKILKADGERVGHSTTLATLTGPLREILAAERTMLNLLGRLCGVAAVAREFAERVAGTRARVLDTRKTTPGLRVLEKYAVRCGGAYCHRIGLFDAVLIKDNHIAGIGVGDLPAFVKGAVASARGHGAASPAFCELEVDSLEQLEAVLRAGGCGLDMVLLDNMPAEMMERAVRMRDEAALARPILLEASGGVRLETIRRIAETGVDRISCGAMTHSVVSADLALDVV